MSEPDALWEQALQEQEEQDRVKKAIAALWERYKDQIPWEDGS